LKTLTDTGTKKGELTLHTRGNKGRSKILEDQRGKKISIEMKRYQITLITGFLISLIISGCSYQRIPGVYTIKRPDNVITLNITNDNRFSYTDRQGLSEKTTSGTWVHKNQEIFLTSDSFYTSINGRVEEEYDINFKDIYLKFLDYDCITSVKQAEVLFNDSLKLYSDSNGIIIINFGFRTLRVKFFPSYEFFYKPANQKSNKYSICLIPARGYEIFFYKERFKVKNNSIIRDNNERFIRKKAP